MIVVLAEMPQNQCGSASIKFMSNIVGHHIVREMTVAAHHALLDGPGVRTHFKHLQIVVGFEHQNVRAAQMKLDGVRNVPKIGYNCDFDALRAKAKPYWI